jgi:hypothetical protein
MRSAIRSVSMFNLGRLVTLGSLRALSVGLIITLLGNSIALAAGTVADPVLLKKALISRGIGKGIRVKQVDGKTVKGTLTGIHDDSLDVTPKHATQMQTIAYSQISDIEETGMTTDSKILIGIGVLGALAVVVILVVLHSGSKILIPQG